MAKHKVAYAISALVLAVGMLPLLAPGDTFANWRGGENEDGEYELYVEVGDQAPVDQIGLKEPNGTASIERIIDDEYADIISHDFNEGCIPHGDSVGKGVITCRYLDGDGEVLREDTITVHVFKDPNYNIEDDFGFSEIKAGESLNLIDYVADYFDNPEEIRVGFFDDGADEAITINGNTAADAVITARDDGAEIGLGTIYFYTPFSTQSNDNLATWDIWVVEDENNDPDVTPPDPVDCDLMPVGAKLDEATLSDEDVDAFKEKASGGTILGYYDVTLILKDKISGNVVQEISENDEAVRVELPFPEDMDLPEVADGYTRVFYVIRDHGGEKDILPAYDNGDGTFHFYSDKFSTYALAYYDVADELAEYVTTTTGTTTAAPETGTVTREGGSVMAASLVTAIAVAVIGSVMGVAMLVRRR